MAFLFKFVTGLFDKLVHRICHELDVHIFAFQCLAAILVAENWGKKKEKEQEEEERTCLYSIGIKILNLLLSKLLYLQF